LIELLLVMVILAVLAAVVVPKFTNRTQDAKMTAAKTDISMLDLALDTFEIDVGRYPTTEEGLAALLQPPPNVTSWKGAYVKRATNDPWGNGYMYRFPGQHNTNGYDLYSLGPDGREGNDDLDNWSQH
jgi:general secretion pathway protein G